MSAFPQKTEIARVTLPLEAAYLLQKMFIRQEPLTPEEAKAFSELVIGMSRFSLQKGGEEWLTPQPQKTAEIISLVSEPPAQLESSLLQQAG